MGLLDWLINDGDIISGGNPMQPGPPMMAPVLDQQGNGVGEDFRRHVPSMQTQPMPPVQGPGMDVPYPMGQDPMTAGGLMPNGPGLPLPYPVGGDPMTAGGDPGNGPGLPPPPMPRPRPPGADAAIPPAAAPTGGAGMPPGPPAPLATPPQAEQPGPTGGRPLDSLLGMDRNTSRRAAGALAAGLKATGENAHKPGLAAFSGSAGAAIEGGEKRDDITTDQQQKYLRAAIDAKRQGDTAAYNINYLKYLKQSAADKLEVEKEKMASGGKGGAINTPEQLYLRAIGATNQDAGIKASANTVREAQKQYGMDSKEAKAAMEAHEKRIKEVRDGHLRSVGVDPGKVGEIANKPGFSDKNPVKDFPKDPAAAQKAFDALPEGAYFINPKDGRLLIKRGAGSSSAANPSQVPTAPGAPQAPLPPALPTANADGDDDGV